MKDKTGKKKSIFPGSPLFRKGSWASDYVVQCPLHVATNDVLFGK